MELQQYERNHLITLLAIQLELLRVKYPTPTQQRQLSWCQSLILAIVTSA